MCEFTTFLSELENDKTIYLIYFTLYFKNQLETGDLASVYPTSHPVAPFKRPYRALFSI